VGDAWYALWAPAGLAPATQSTFSDAVASLMREPQTRQRLAALGLVSVGSSPDGLAIGMADAVKTWAPIIGETGYRADQ
jgi:tripartite-type tricarboxylate transporter receptor subunit TctC